MLTNSQRPIEFHRRSADSLRSSHSTPRRPGKLFPATRARFHKVLLIAMSLLALGLLSSCPSAGAGNGGKAPTTVRSKIVAWTSASPTTGTLINVKRAIVTGTGPYTLTVPSGVALIHAVVVGGGGAGWYDGGGAGYIRAGVFTVSAGEELTLTVGAGGTPHATDQTTVDGKTSSIKKGNVNIMSAQGGKGITQANRTRGGGRGSGGGGGGINAGGNGGYCASGSGTGSSQTPGGVGGNNPDYTSGSAGSAPADCTDVKSGVKYGAGGGGGNFRGRGAGGTGGTSTAAGTSGGNPASRAGTAGADHYGAGGGGGGGGTSETNNAAHQGAGGKGVIVLYVD